MTTWRTLTGRITDHVESGLRAAVVMVENNLTGTQALVDIPTSTVLMHGPIHVKLGTNYDFAVQLVDTAGVDTNVDDGTLRYRVRVHYWDGAGNTLFWPSPWFSLTADATLASKVVDEYVDPVVGASYVDQMQDLIDQAEAITGLTGEDAAVALLVNTPSSSTREALDALLAGSPQTIPYLEGVPMYVYGDSYTQLDPPDSTPGPRVARTHRMLTPVNRGVSGARFRDIFDRIAATWTPNTRGLVLIGDGTINNIQAYPATAAGYATAREAFRALLAFLSDRSVRVAADSPAAGMAFGPSWTATSDGFTGGVGAYVDIAWNSNELDVFCEYVTGAGGTIEFRNPAGTLIATGTTGGYSESITGVIVVPSQGAGAHTVRATVTAGTVKIRRAGARAATPPVIVWDKAGPIPFGGTAVGTTQLRASQAQEILAAQAFDNVIVSDNDVPQWDMDEMISADTAHRSDAGQRFATETMNDALRSAITDYQQGLNAVELYTADAPHVTPTAAYTGPGAVAPATPVLSAVAGFQVRLTWTRPSDGGSTLTGYLIQSSPAGAGTWTTLATITNPAATAYTVESGLTPASSYDFRIRASNAIGSGSYSATSTATAGPLPSFHSRDDFDRADDTSLGNAVVGGAWTAYNAVFGINDHHAAQIGSKSNASLWAHATVNDGQGGGYGKVRLTKLDPVSCGVVMNINSAAAPTLGVAVLAYMPSNDYRMMVQINATTWVVVATYPIAPADGDEVGIYRDGLNYYAVINGVVQTVYVGSTNLAGTNHGVIAFSSGAEWDDYSHTNIDPR